MNYGVEVYAWSAVEGERPIKTWQRMKPSNGPAYSGADGGYVRLRPHVVNADGPVLESPDYGAPKGMVREHDPVAEERACAQVHRRVLAWRAGLRNWIIDAAGSCKPEHGCSIELQGDPRELPGEGEAVAV